MKENIHYIQDIISVLESNNTLSKKRQLLEDYHDYEIAKVLTHLSKSNKRILYDVLTEEELADVFEELTPEDAFEILEETSLTVIT